VFELFLHKKCTNFNFNLLPLFSITRVRCWCRGWWYYNVTCLWLQVTISCLVIFLCTFLI